MSENISTVLLNLLAATALFFLSLIPIQVTFWVLYRGNKGGDQKKITVKFNRTLNNT